MKQRMNTPLVITAMCIGIFISMLDTTIMNIALPAIQTGLKVPLNSLSWALNVYTILFATLTIPIGKLADIFGQHKVYLIGLGGFLIGSLVCGTAPSLSQLIIGRAIQSISAAIVFPTSMTIGISTSNSKTRQKTIAALGVTQGLATVLGPVIGGIVTQFVGWRWIFFINIPIVLISLILCLTQLQFKNEKHTSEKIDWLGSITSMAMLFSLVLALIKGNDWGWTSFTTLALFGISLLSLILFIFTENKIKSPMIDFKLFKNRQFNGSAVAIVLSNLFLVGVNVILPTFFTKVENKSELTAALLITPISLMIFIFSPIAAVLIDKVGARIIIFLGFSSMAISYYLLYHIDPNNLSQLIPTCLFLGFGYGIIAGPITVLAASDFKGSLLTASQSVSGVLRQIGVTLAVAIFVSGLTSNVIFQKNKSVQQADTITQKMSVPEKYRSDTYKNAKKTILNGDSQTHANKNKPAIIKRETASIIATQKLENAPKNIKDNIQVQVTKKVDSIFKTIDSTANEISSKTKSNIKLAYTNLYKNAFGFVVVSVLCTILFEKKKSRRKISNVNK
jgi:drug resistance transporter, EmrB/QacA subfamily